jgi:hypothetical protein
MGSDDPHSPTHLLTRSFTPPLTPIPLTHTTHSHAQPTRPRDGLHAPGTLPAAARTWDAACCCTHLGRCLLLHAPGTLGRAARTCDAACCCSSWDAACCCSSWDAACCCSSWDAACCCSSSSHLSRPRAGLVGVGATVGHLNSFELSGQAHDGPGVSGIMMMIIVMPKHARDGCDSCSRCCCGCSR